VNEAMKGHVRLFIKTTSVPIVLSSTLKKREERKETKRHFQKRKKERTTSYKKERTTSY